MTLNKITMTKWEYEPYDCGLYPAVPGSPENQGMSNVWIRDNYYIYKATEEESIIDGFAEIVRKHEDKIREAINGNATEDYMHIHPRYDENLEEVDGEWGWLQWDAVGNLYELLAQKPDQHDYELNLIRKYVKNVPMYEIPDNGMWEEEKDYHPSSYAAILRGLRNDPHIQRGNWDELRDKYMRAMVKHLPRKDLATATCIWPVNHLGSDTTVRQAIIDDLEELTGEHGTKRYHGDTWSGVARDAPHEPHWPFGLAWMYMITGEEQYWVQLKQLRHFHDELPESFIEGEPNSNHPLLWSEAMFRVAEKHRNNLAMEDTYG